MTTAHRPTIVPAKGGEEQGGMRIFVPSRMFSAKDEASHTKLKFRSASPPPSLPWHRHGTPFPSQQRFPPVPASRLSVCSCSRAELSSICPVAGPQCWVQ